MSRSGSPIRWNNPYLNGDIQLESDTLLNPSGQDLQKEYILLQVGDESTNLTAAAGKLFVRLPYKFTVSEVRASVNTAPTGSTIVVDVNKNGTSILSTKLSIDENEKTSTTAATPAVISTAQFAEDDEVSVDIDQIGSSTAGKGLKVWLVGKRN